MKNVGQTITKLRVDREWTQHELSRLSGIEQSHISKLEHGAFSPNLKTLAALAKAFDVSISELTGI